MGRLLVGDGSVGSAAIGRVLGKGSAALARGHELAQRVEDAGELSADLAGQRVATASAMVRAERDGRPARRGYRTRATEQSLPLPGQADGAQEIAVHVSARSLEGPVSG